MGGGWISNVPSTRLSQLTSGGRRWYFEPQLGHKEFLTFQKIRFLGATLTLNLLRKTHPRATDHRITPPGDPLLIPFPVHQQGKALLWPAAVIFLSGFSFFTKPSPALGSPGRFVTVVGTPLGEGGASEGVAGVGTFLLG